MKDNSGKVGVHEKAYRVLFIILIVFLNGCSSVAYKKFNYGNDYPLYEEVKEKQHLSLYEEYFTQFPYGTRQSVWNGEVDRKKELLQDYYHAVIELNKRGAFERFLELLPHEVSPDFIDDTSYVEPLFYESINHDYYRCQIEACILTLDLHKAAEGGNIDELEHVIYEEQEQIDSYSAINGIINETVVEGKRVVYRAYLTCLKKQNDKELFQRFDNHLRTTDDGYRYVDIKKHNRDLMRINMTQDLIGNYHSELHDGFNPYGALANPYGFVVNDGYWYDNVKVLQWLDEFSLLVTLANPQNQYETKVIHLSLERFERGIVRKEVFSGVFRYVGTFKYSSVIQENIVPSFQLVLMYQ